MYFDDAQWFLVIVCWRGGGSKLDGCHDDKRLRRIFAMKSVLEGIAGVIFSMGGLTLNIVCGINGW